MKRLLRTLFPKTILAIEQNAIEIELENTRLILNVSITDQLQKSYLPPPKRTVAFINASIATLKQNNINARRDPNIIKFTFENIRLMLSDN